MSSDLGVLELECDAPPYAIVRACRMLGMNAPEDVRWCRKGRPHKEGHGWMSFLARRTWGRLLGRGQAEEPTCICGRSLPDLECYSFLFQTGEQVEYAMTQCPRCRTICWEKI